MKRTENLKLNEKKTEKKMTKYLKNLKSKNKIDKGTN